MSDPSDDGDMEAQFEIWGEDEVRLRLANGTFLPPPHAKPNLGMTLQAA